MVFNATFNNISDISSMMVNFIGEGNQNTWRKTVTDKLYQVILYPFHQSTRFKLPVIKKKKRKMSSLLKKGSGKNPNKLLFCFLKSNEVI
jgi:hypothetical protein